MQYVEDDGTCAELLTKNECLEGKTLFDKTMPQCSWRDKRLVTTYDDFFACQYVSPVLSWQVRK